MKTPQTTISPQPLTPEFRAYLRSPVVINHYGGTVTAGICGVQADDPQAYYSKRPDGMYVPADVTERPKRQWTEAERAYKRAYNQRRQR